jgi:hypothetical protein
MPSNRWRIPWVAEWCEMRVDLEEGTLTASDRANKMRLEDRIGFSTAGLAEMGWKVAVDEVAPKRAEKQAAKPKSSRDRLKMVPGGN